MKQSIKKIAYITIGCISLGVGVIGIVTPIIPTTPFLLLTAACFFRGSPRLYQQLLQNRLFGPYIHTWREYHAITIRAKVCLLTVLWVTLVSSAVFFTDNILIRIVLGCVGIGVSTHLLMMKTLTKEMKVQIEKNTTPEI